MNADGYIGVNGSISGSNLFAYCDNNVVQRFDPFGYDAIVLYDSYFVTHIGMIVQDEEGVWWHYYWGVSGLTNKFLCIFYSMSRGKL